VSAAEHDIRVRLGARDLDFTAMSAVSNIYRAGTAVRNHMERTVLGAAQLSWVGFTVLWVLWIWGERETGHLASEAGVSKGTLTGVLRTLATRELIERRAHHDDRRRVSVRLTRAGERLIATIFPEFNRHEALAVAALSNSEQHELARLLRRVQHHLDDLENAH
jgi:DNA-binding MarR family transcriptional regulator